MMSSELRSYDSSSINSNSNDDARGKSKLTPKEGNQNRIKVDQTRDQIQVILLVAVLLLLFSCSMHQCLQKERPLMPGVCHFLLLSLLWHCYRIWSRFVRPRLSPCPTRTFAVFRTTVFATRSPYSSPYSPPVCFFLVVLSAGSYSAKSQN